MKSEITVYFGNLKEEMKKRSRKKNNYMLLFFVLLVVSLFAGMYFYMFDNTLERMLGQDNLFFKFLLGILMFFSSILFFATRNLFNPSNLKKEQDINLYAALDFIFQKEKKFISEKEFEDFKKIMYEKEKHNEILKINASNFNDFEKIKKEIEYIYENKQKLVTREYVLHKEYYHRYW